MRTLLGVIGAVLLLALVAMAKPKLGAQSEQPFPGTLRNARYVYVAAYDGDEFNLNLLPADRAAIVAVQNAIQAWGKLIVVYRPQDADIIIRVESRPSEDVLAVYDAKSPSDQYLWRAMGRDGLQLAETPLVTQFEKGFEGVQAKSNSSK
jgi:hypothetical protein